MRFGFAPLKSGRADEIIRWHGCGLLSSLPVTLDPGALSEAGVAYRNCGHFFFRAAGEAC
jgi:hypothetical protein